MVITSENNQTKYRRYGSIQLRYAMTYVVITFVVLLFLNIYCSEISQLVFFGSKQTAVLEKALLLSKEIGNLEVMTPSGIEAAIAKIGDATMTRLVVTDDSARIIYDTLSGGEEYILLPQIIRALDCVDTFTCHYFDGVIQSQVAVPVVNYNTVSGCVYLLEYDQEQGALIQTLQRNIFTITLVLELFVLMFSLVYARSFSGRLRKVTRSMRIIQDGDYSHKVSLGGHDELTFLGQEVNHLTERLQLSEGKRRQFVSDASHELKTPLASIKLLSDSILQYDMDMDTVREFVTDIGNEAERLNRMTQKLLSLTKSENAVELDEKEIILISPTLDRVVRMLSGIAESNHIAIHVDIQKEEPVLVQEDDLYQIIFNLVENGIKYNAPNGNLYISLSLQEDMVVLQVRDTGVGIPEESLDQIFERFYRVDKARSRQSGGSGLGLAIVKAMVERNGGEISVESNVGQGSTFTVQFPSFSTVEDEPWEE